MKYKVIIGSAVFFFVPQIHAYGEKISGFYLEKIINNTGQELFIKPNQLLNTPAIKIEAESKPGDFVPVRLLNVVDDNIRMATIQICRDAAGAQVLGTLAIIINKDQNIYHAKASFFIGQKKVFEWDDISTNKNQSYPIQLILEKDLLGIIRFKTTIIIPTQRVQCN